MPVLSQKRQILKDYLDMEEKLTALALTDPAEMMAFVDRLVHEAYIAGVNKEEGGIYRHPGAIQTIGQVCNFADSWCKYKGTRP